MSRDIRANLRSFEGTAIDFVSATTPWLAPLIPATIAFEHMSGALDFDGWLAFVGAIVIEFLGLSTVHTSMQFWTYNQTRRKSDDEAPVWIPVAIGIFYLGLILTVNVLLSSGDWKWKLATTLLSLVSVPASLVIAMRAQHAARLEQIASEKEARRTSRRKVAGKSPETRPESRVTSRREVAGKSPESRRREDDKGDTNFPGDWRLLTHEHKQALRGLPASKIAELTGTSERTARTWRAQIEKESRELATSSNGHGAH